MQAPCALYSLPAETILHIFSYLDLPDLESVARVSPFLAALASDPVLHLLRIKVVAPSRVNHALFGAGPHGTLLRPTVGDLIQRNVMCGLGLERQWRMGFYFYSAQSVKQYETGLHLKRKRAGIVISSQLRRRFSHAHALQTLHNSRVLPDIESASLSISRSLLPTVRQLKWAIQKDKLASMVRQTRNQDGSFSKSGFGMWFERKGSRLVHDDERVRLALCPSVRKIVGFYEALAR